MNKQSENKWIIESKDINPRGTYVRTCVCVHTYMTERQQNDRRGSLHMGDQHGSGGWQSRNCCHCKNPVEGSPYQ